jgi:hypothetical protein
MIRFRQCLVILVFLLSACGRQGTILLTEDGFGEQSRGRLRDNIVQLPPPRGLGFQWNVLESGYEPLHWEMFDESGPADPKRGFWVIHPDSGYLQQAGRSRNSILFCNTAVPDHISAYDINFSQFRGDNDYIGYILGAPGPSLYPGIEFGYMTQVPGTDSTTKDAFVKGALGEFRVPEMALMRQWANHRIEVRDSTIAWYLNEELMAKGTSKGVPLHGLFGIRHRYDRNTCYRKFKIILYP